MVKVGITGGIGSGKSTVCKVWESLGAYVINADDLAKDLMSNDGPVKQAVKERFGAESYHPDGSLNRAYLAREAFEKGRVEELNAIVHPQIPGEVKSLMESAEKQGYDLVVYEAALLLQNLPPDFLDSIVLVLADEEKRIEWVQKRDETNRSAVTDRINTQQNFDDFINLADIIIRNEGSLNELKKKARDVYQQLLK